MKTIYLYEALISYKTYVMENNQSYLKSFSNEIVEIRSSTVLKTKEDFKKILESSNNTYMIRQDLVIEGARSVDILNFQDLPV
jgi:hypothetical protein